MVGGYIPKDTLHIKYVEGFTDITPPIKENQRAHEMEIG